MDYPEPQVGYWWTPMFLEDLARIDSPRELAHVRQQIAELVPDGIKAKVYATQAEAEADPERMVILRPSR